VTPDERWMKRNFCSRVVWRKGLGGTVPQYGPEQFLDGIDDELCEFVSTVDTGDRRGVLAKARPAIGSAVGRTAEPASRHPDRIGTRHGRASGSTTQIGPRPCTTIGTS